MSWTSLKSREAPLHTSWQADEIVITRGDELIDQLPAEAIERVTLVHATGGDSPGEIRAAIFELTDRIVLVGAGSGIAGRVLFERQAYWSQRACIYWISERHVSWPEVRGESRWPFGRQIPQHRNLAPTMLGALLERADATGPHTWDQRKQWRIERRRPFRGRAMGVSPAHHVVMP